MMNMLYKTLDSLNIKKRCDEYNVTLWGCPQFLFVLMGVIIIMSIMGTDFVARKYTEPEVAALIVIAITVFLLIIGHAIVTSFEKIALTSRAKSEFISVVSHELRNPLSDIKWQINMLTDKEMNLSEKDRRESIEIIEGQNRKMLHMVNSMLEIHKVQEGVFDFRPENFSLLELASSVIEGYKSLAKKHNAKFKLNVIDGSFMVFADRKKIQVVIEHFIDNALKYGKDGGEVAISLDKKTRKIKLSVKDQGVGIPKEDVRKIFSRFFRAHNVLRYKIEGIGLGLYMARSIIEESGGRISFDSQEGGGSTFWFTLPVAKSIGSANS